MGDKSYVLTKKKKYFLWDYIRIPFLVTPCWVLVRLIYEVGMAILPAIQIYIVARFIDITMGIYNGIVDYGEIVMPLVWLVLLVVYKYIGPLVIQLVNAKIVMKLNADFTTEVIQKRASLKYEYIENKAMCDLIHRTCDQVQQKITQGMDTLLSGMSIPLRLLALMITITNIIWWMGGIILLFSLPILYVAFRAGKVDYEAYKEVQEVMRKANYLDEVLTNREGTSERFLFNFSESISRRWEKEYNSARKILYTVEGKNFLKLKGASLITIGIAGATIGMLITPLGKGEITVGMLISITQAVFSLVQLMSFQLGYTVRTLVNGQKFLEDFTIFCGLDDVPKVLEIPDRSQGQVESIEFVDVSFKYPQSEQPVLKNVSFRLEKGKHYALVGENGCGKTTIIKLLTGLYDSYTGEILINGHDIKRYSKAQLKALCSLVHQDFARYSLSVKDNIAIGSEGVMIGDEIIEEVLKKVSLYETVMQFPEGINTPLGKIRHESCDLSVGQWQRLAIARSLLSEPALHILDEPTASLDPISESKFYSLFSAITKEQMVLLITHRLGACRLAERIFVLKEGEIAESGSHEELMKINGIYADMYMSQREWYC